MYVYSRMFLQRKGRSRKNKGTRGKKRLLGLFGQWTLQKYLWHFPRLIRQVLSWLRYTLSKCLCLDQTSAADLMAKLSLLSWLCCTIPRWKNSQALDFNEGVVNAVVHRKFPALLGQDRSFLPQPSPCAWKALTVPLHINPIPVLDAGRVKLMNSSKIRILQGCAVLGILGGFFSVHVTSCSRDLVGHVVVWKHWSECPELEKIHVLEMEALGAVGFVLDCFPDWYYLKKCIRERMFDFKSAWVPTLSLFVFLPLAETL